MGLPMAKRVIAAGHDLVTVRHRRREPAAELEAMGARVVAVPAQAARGADVVITIVPADAELIETTLGPDGLIHGLSSGGVLIDMTTALPRTIQHIEQTLAGRNAKVLDAPVSGGPTGAAQGTLTIMVGGDAVVLDQVRALLASLGTTIVHVGGVGQGKVVKMVNQLMAAINLLGMGEAFALGVRCGADPAMLYQVVKNASGHSRMLDSRLPGFLLDGSFQPGFKLDLMKKDVNLALESARALNVPLLLGGAAGQLFAAASSAGHGEEDFSAAAEFLAGLARATLKRRQEQ
jgi:3-hydroxyisobutyrate dehydrogenase-like beta-hydroxyacid dehydrogenase